MKRMGLFLMALIGCCCLGAVADDGAEEDSGSNVLQICFAPGVPGDSLTSTTYGVKVGAPISDGAPVFGVEASVLYAGSDEVNGFQGSLISAKSEEVNGIQLSLVNFVQECTGIQLGIVNFAKDKTFQLGILNFVEDGWLPVCPIMNFQF